jgi:hypothetical protein
MEGKMNFFKAFWQFWLIDEDDHRIAARKTAKQQAEQEQKTRQEVENHHQSRVDADAMLDEFEREGMPDEFGD